VGVRVGTSHSGTLVLEDLHVAILLLGLGNIGVVVNRLDVGGRRKLG
jgi:hypothetical protein